MTGTCIMEPDESLPMTATEDTWSTPHTDGRAIAIMAMVGLQLVLFYWALFGEAIDIITSSTAVYVTALIFVGYVTNHLRSPRFLTVLFAGWSLLMTASYAIGSETGHAVLAVFTAICAAYYAL
ncbi:hypothetical protein C482_14254 [Natrialba chahannaoensis JCM 10990]|uniref:Uncharacterized protein n=1 Tax=Natrialba chahannaoensis JCM 10990 TaxID=1227492 RepID=M0ADV0_9EURY|nr:hypothetical protein [Natrialba chahannaoensis]ELY96940.1 hypothetical protein C482_14254 [Natrialba chahannaoensis JCM 10990]